MYSDENLNILYEGNKCKKNHNLKWTGGDYVNDFHLNCAECENNSFNKSYYEIRWVCNECNEYYCQRCRPILKYFQCPNNHLFVLNIDKFIYLSYTCDSCFETKDDIQNIFIDKICNVTFCRNCIPDKEAFIYHVRED